MFRFAAARLSSLTTMKSFPAVHALAAMVIVVALLVHCKPATGAASAAPAVAEAVNPLLNPPVNDGHRLPVAIAMRVINISDIDEVTQRFKMVGYLVARWTDPRLAYTRQAPWDKFRTFSPGEIWFPRFDFVNGIVPHSASDVTIRVFPNGTVRYSERSSAELANTFHLRKFPFDQQTLEILIHPTVSDDQLVDLMPDRSIDPISAEPRVYDSLAQWRISAMNATVQQVPGMDGESVSEIRLTVEIVRHFNFYLWKVFLPLVLMVVLSWTVFWIDPDDLGSQVQISVTTILTMIAFAFAIQSNLPKVPYLTYIDVFFLICYLFVFATSIELTTVNVVGRSGRGDRARRMRRISSIGLPAAFFVVNLIVVLIYFD